MRRTHLDAAQQAELDAAQSALMVELDGYREDIVATVPEGPSRERLRPVLWGDDASLPRGHAAGGRIAVTLVRTVHAGLAAESGDPPRDLERFAVAFQRYADLFDDVVDGDVRPGHDAAVLLHTQTLLGVAMTLLARIGADAVGYWSTHLHTLVDGVCLEKTAEPSLNAYLAVLDRQSWFYGHLAGLAAMCAGAIDDSDARQAAEELGRLVYRYDQTFRDLAQRDRDGGRDDNWTITRWLDDEGAEALLRRWQAEIWRIAASTLRPDAARTIRMLVSVDHDTRPARTASEGGRG